MSTVIDGWREQYSSEVHDVEAVSEVDRMVGRWDEVDVHTICRSWFCGDVDHRRYHDHLDAYGAYLKEREKDKERQDLQCNSNKDFIERRKSEMNCIRRMCSLVDIISRWSICRTIASLSAAASDVQGGVDAAEDYIPTRPWPAQTWPRFFLFFFKWVV